ncbi:MAG: GatB/YqeY domain-containing protein [Actinomycetota bacterium]|nr:GatB/YqeY domain-containing protein [Actinomycetota bacterium]
MGEVASRISGEMQAAMKSGERMRLGTLRMLATSIRNREIEVGHDLTDDEFLEVVGREVKRRREAADAFAGAGRDELAEKERAEQAVLEAYLPEQLSEEEVRGIVEEAVTATGASGAKEAGKVIGYVMSRHKGRIDGGLVNRLARERLGADGSAR